MAKRIKYTTSIQHGREYSLKHNNRELKEEHINPDGYHETIRYVDPVQDIMGRFEKVVEEYNARQSRKDRQIELKEYAKTGKEKIHELIVMVGRYGQKPDAEITYSALKKFVESWEERNPNLRLIGAFLHDDELGGAHLHLDFYGVGHQYSRGLSEQISFSKALEEMGFCTGKENGKFNYAVVKWQNRERKVLDDICKEHGLSIHHPKVEEQQHMKIQIYKDAVFLKELEQRVENLLAKEAEIRENNVKFAERMKTELSPYNYEVTIPRYEYESLVRTSVAFEAVEIKAEIRQKRNEEMERTIGELKYDVKKLEKINENLEEKVNAYEDVLEGLHNQDGMNALDFIKEKIKKKASKSKHKEKDELIR